MCFALLMIILDNRIVNVALPSIQRDLHAWPQPLEWTINAYTLTFAVLMVTTGDSATASAAASRSCSGWLCSEPPAWRSG